MIAVLLLFAQIDINIELDKAYANKKLTIGDPFEINLTLTCPQNTEISAPYIDSIEPFVILDQQSSIIQEKGTVTTSYKMKFAAFKTGDLKIPAFKFLHRKPDATDTLKSNTVPINIASVMSESMQDINDIKKAVAFPDYLPFIIAGIMIACAVVGYFLFKFIKKLQKARFAAIPLSPPWIEAIVAIDSIPIKEWLEKGFIKKYYYALSEILKRYIERRFEFNAAEQTTTELINNLKLQKVPLRDEFSRFFLRADMVKYAKFIPPQEESKTVVHNVKELINNTKPKEPEKKK